MSLNDVLVSKSFEGKFSPKVFSNVGLTGGNGLSIITFHLGSILHIPSFSSHLMTEVAYLLVSISLFELDT